MELDEECRIGFFVHYDNGQTAEVSWSFVREFPPKDRDAAPDAAKTPQVVAEAPAKYITRRRK